MDIVTLALAKKYADGKIEKLFDKFDETKSYAAMEIVIHDGTVYQFTSAKAAGPWDDSIVTAVDLSELTETIQASAIPKPTEDGEYVVKIENGVASYAAATSGDTIAHDEKGIYVEF